MLRAITPEAILRRDRVIVIVALGAVVAACWLYLLHGAGMDMGEGAAMEGMDMAMAGPAWSLPYAGLMAAMWVVMMAAMMLPSSAPMLLLHATVARRRHAGMTATGLFAAGYLAIWSTFALLATGLQWWLAGTGLLSPHMTLTGRAIASALLVAAGAYQWTRAKNACLTRCRSPLDFVMTHWRDGRLGGFAMGIRHGAYCVGCCWLLMLLLFVGGLMNLAWVALLALLVLVEKVAPRGEWVARAAGVAMIVAGIAMMSMPIAGSMP